MDNIQDNCQNGLYLRQMSSFKILDSCSSVSDNRMVSRQLITLISPDGWIDLVYLVPLSVSSQSEFYEINATVGDQQTGNMTTVHLLSAVKIFQEKFTCQKAIVCLSFKVLRPSLSEKSQNRKWSSK